MCGRYTLHASTAELASLAGGIPEGFREERRYNIAPGQWSIVIRPDHGGGRVLAAARWGLVPTWAKDPEAGPKPINARAEGLAEKATFRGAFRHGRCLVPASGFYEWQRVGKARLPHYIRPRHGGLLVFAGLWSEWAGPEGELPTFTIITTTPNAVMASLHDRMPVILGPEDQARWMGGATREAASLLRPCPEAWLEAHPVGPEVGNARSEGPELIQAWP